MGTRSLYEQVTELLSSNIPITSFVDMDGVLAEYKYGEGKLILDGDVGVYSSKRPIKTVINFIAKYYDVNSNEFKILTSCITKEQGKVKLEWIKRHMKFFNPKDFIYVLNKDFSTQRENKKVDIIMNHATEHPERKKILVIEDTHSILEKCWEKEPERILPVHVINLIK